MQSHVILSIMSFYTEALAKVQAAILNHTGIESANVGTENIKYTMLSDLIEQEKVLQAQVDLEDGTAATRTLGARSRL